MGRYIADRNIVNFAYESGTYATVSGTNQWIGQVQNHEPDQNLGIISTRYAGTDSRNVAQFVNGPEDYTGTITYFPQDWKMLGFALGSIVDAGSPSPFSHTLKELNNGETQAFTSGARCPFPSFTVVDQQTGAANGEHFVKTINGAVIDSFTITGGQGDIVTCEVGYIAQDSPFTSGAITAATVPTTRPFVWKDVKIHIPSGTVISETKDFSFSLNNNMLGPHYLNGSAVIDVPFALNRDYELTLTVDSTSERTKEFYDAKFKGGAGSTFNALIEITDTEAGAGSRDLFISLSGCVLNPFESATPAEGIDEQTLTIIPQNAEATVADLIELYGAF